MDTSLQAYYESKLVPLEKGPASCVDERGMVWDEKRRRSYQLCGGSNEIHDLLLIVCYQAGIDIDDLPSDINGDPVNLLEVAHRVFESPVAENFGLEPGVHNDDEHGHITDPQELETRTQGCGHDRVRANVLAKGWGINLGSNQPLALVPLELEKGVHNETYTGNHFSNAMPVENFKTGTTLDTQTVLDEGKPAFNHDIWVIAELKETMAQELEGLDGPYVKAAKYLRDHIVEDSKKVYRLTLAELGNPNNGEIIEVGK